MVVIAVVVAVVVAVVQMRMLEAANYIQAAPVTSTTHICLWRRQ